MSALQRDMRKKTGGPAPLRPLAAAAVSPSCEPGAGACDTLEFASRISDSLIDEVRRLTRGVRSTTGIVSDGECGVATLVAKLQSLTDVSSEAVAQLSSQRLLDCLLEAGEATQGMTERAEATSDATVVSRIEEFQLALFPILAFLVSLPSVAYSPGIFVRLVRSRFPETCSNDASAVSSPERGGASRSPASDAWFYHAGCLAGELLFHAEGCVPKSDLLELKQVQEAIKDLMLSRRRAAASRVAGALPRGTTKASDAAPGPTPPSQHQAASLPPSAGDVLAEAAPANNDVLAEAAPASDVDVAAADEPPASDAEQPFSPSADVLRSMVDVLFEVVLDAFNGEHRRLALRLCSSLENAVVMLASRGRAIHAGAPAAEADADKADELVFVANYNKILATKWILEYIVEQHDAKAFLADVVKTLVRAIMRWPELPESWHGALRPVVAFALHERLVRETVAELWAFFHATLKASERPNREWVYMAGTFAGESLETLQRVTTVAQEPTLFDMMWSVQHTSRAHLACCGLEAIASRATGEDTPSQRAGAPGEAVASGDDALGPAGENEEEYMSLGSSLEEEERLDMDSCSDLEDFIDVSEEYNCYGLLRSFDRPAQALDSNALMSGSLAIEDCTASGSGMKRPACGDKLSAFGSSTEADDEEPAAHVASGSVLKRPAAEVPGGVGAETAADEEHKRVWPQNVQVHCKRVCVAGWQAQCQRLFERFPPELQLPDPEQEVAVASPKTNALAAPAVVS